MKRTQPRAARKIDLEARVAAIEVELEKLKATLRKTVDSTLTDPIDYKQVHALQRELTNALIRNDQDAADRLGARLNALLVRR